MTFPLQFRFLVNNMQIMANIMIGERSPCWQSEKGSIIIRRRRGLVRCKRHVWSNLTLNSAINWAPWYFNKTHQDQPGSKNDQTSRKSAQIPLNLENSFLEINPKEVPKVPNHHLKSAESRPKSYFRKIAFWFLLKV